MAAPFEFTDSEVSDSEDFDSISANIDSLGVSFSSEEDSETFSHSIEGNPDTVGVVIAPTGAGASPGFNFAAGFAVNIEDGGELIGSTIRGGEVVVESGQLIATAISSFNGAHGQVDVGPGGTALNTTLNFETDMEVLGESAGSPLKALAFNTLVLGGADLFVASGGITSGTVLNGLSDADHANEWVVNGGTARGTVVNNFGDQIVFGDNDEGTIAFNTVVNNGGHMILTDSGTASGATINSGGFDLVLDGGAAFDTHVVGGREVVEGPATGFDSGLAHRTTVDAGGAQLVFGFADFTTVNVGTQVVWSGGLSVSGTMNGKTAFDFIVGSSFQQILNTGATEFVVSNGVAEDTQVRDTTVQEVSAGSTALFTDVFRGGIQVVNAGGLATGTDLEGTEFVEAGGTTRGTTVAAGGIESVLAGGSALGTLISGGLVEVQGGATVPVITFDGDAGGTLLLDASTTFGGAIAGFASPPGVTENLDLRDLVFKAGSTKVSFAEAATGTSGTLSVTNGTQTANLTLLGNYSTTTFTVQSDGAGGTLVLDPPAHSGTNPVLAGSV